MNTKQTVYNILASSKTKEVTEVNLATVSELSAAYAEFAKMREDVLMLTREMQQALPKFSVPGSKLSSLFPKFRDLGIKIIRMEDEFSAKAKELGMNFDQINIPNNNEYSSSLSNISGIENEAKEMLKFYSKFR
jgi:hypothetical protein